MEKIFFDEDPKDVLHSLNKGVDVDSFKEIWDRSRWHYAIEYLIECRLVDATYYDGMDYTGYVITDKCPDNKTQNLDNNVMADTIIIDKKQTTDFSK